MPLPGFVAQLNKRFVNRLMRPLAAHPPFGLLTHVGRKSGRRYQIPINVFPRRGGFLLCLTYGRDTDWVKNVLAADGAELFYDGSDYHLANPRIVGRDRAWPDLPLMVKPLLWLVGVRDFILADA
ncbi:MAG: nitroreductase family deazaflavin-dependent oxidoreductase [Acidimicrobiia bacterium]